MTWHLYILSCGKQGYYYTGIATDVSQCVLQHQLRKGGRYTANRWPYVLLVFEVACTDKSEALKLEKRVKRLSRKQKEQFMRRGGATWRWLLSQNAKLRTAQAPIWGTKELLAAKAADSAILNR